MGGPLIRHRDVKPPKSILDLSPEEDLALDLLARERRMSDRHIADLLETSHANVQNIRRRALARLAELAGEWSP